MTAHSPERQRRENVNVMMRKQRMANQPIKRRPNNEAVQEHACAAPKTGSHAAPSGGLRAMICRPISASWLPSRIAGSGVT